MSCAWWKRAVRPVRDPHRMYRTVYGEQNPWVVWLLAYAPWRADRRPCEVRGEMGVPGVQVPGLRRVLR